MAAAALHRPGRAGTLVRGERAGSRPVKASSSPYPEGHPRPPNGAPAIHHRIAALETPTLVAATGDIVYEHDYTCDRVAWGGTFTALLGYAPEEMGQTGESWSSRVHPEDAGAVRAEIESAIAEGRVAELEYRFRARDDSYRWFHDRGILELDGQGCLVRVVGVMRDVTARRLTERERDRFFDLSLDLFCVASPDGYFTRVNPAFSRVLGYTADELVDRPYIEFVHPDDRGRTAVQAGRLQSGLPVLKFDNRYIHKGGAVHWLSWNATVDPEDGLIYAVARDMTDQKEIERHERLMARELDHRVKNTLAGVLAALEQTRAGSRSNDEFGEKLAGRVRAMAAAHDLLARSHWKGASLRHAAAGVLAPYSAGGERAEIAGPDVTLAARAAPAICLTLHELVTNAAKHGAFSVPGGSVRVSWVVDGDGARSRLRLLWEERGGPVVKPPPQRGYGTDFIEHSVPYEVGGSVSLAFAPTGVRCEIVCPLPRRGSDAGGDTE